MDDEEAFQKALDENPDDHTLRTIFADWLDEHDDPRGPGYRALGANRRRPRLSGPDWTWFGVDVRWIEQENWLPKYWRLKLPAEWMYGSRHRTRREAEDAAAFAFAKLPKKQRAELLKQTDGTASVRS